MCFFKFIICGKFNVFANSQQPNPNSFIVSSLLPPTIALEHQIFTFLAPLASGNRQVARFWPGKHQENLL